jgi:hypothetical protein
MRCFCLLLLVSSLADAANIRFQSPQTIANGSPIFMTQGDFNGDGHPDLVVAGFPESGGSAVFLFEGLGNGQFAVPVSIFQADWLWQVVTGDFNNDGKLDVAVRIVPNTGSATVVVLLGNGNGTFQPPVTTIIPSSAFPGAIIAGDFNKDGKLDIAVTDNNGDLQIFPGNGDGTFGVPVIANVGGLISGLVAADFNRDGKLDIALNTTPSGSSVNDIQVLLGNGDGTFKSPSTVLTTGGAGLESGLAAGDLNGDGIPDLVALEGSPSSAQILLGNGDGTFQEALSYYVSRFPSAVLIRDVTGDGIPDLILACSEYGLAAGGELAVLPGNGDGTFNRPIVSLLGTDASIATAGDYNSDGHLDLALMSDFTVLIAPGDGKGYFQQPANYPAGSNPAGVVAADFTGNGILDIAVTNANGFNLLPGTGNGHFGTPQRFTQGSFYTEFEITGDFNHDGITDLVEVGSGDPFGGTPYGLQVYFGGSSGLTAGPTTYPLPFFINSLATGHFKTGGALDIALAFFASGNRGPGVALLPGKGDGSFSSPRVLLSSNGASAIVSADFNGDGKLDLAFADGQQIMVLLGNGDGTFQSPIASAAPNDQFNAAAAADVNGDGKPDLVLPGFLYNQVYAMLGNGDGTFQPAKAFPTDKAPQSVVIADFNCDGKLDLATANYNGNDASVLLGNGDGTFQPRTSFAAGGFPTGIALGDFQGNGKKSLAVSNSGSTTVTVLLNTTLVKPGACR